MVWRGVLLLCWHRLGCGSEDRALALYIRDAWLGTTNWGTSTNRRPIEPTAGTGRRPQRHRQIRSTLSDTCHGPPTRSFSPRPKASPTGRPYLARVGSGLRRFSVPLLLTGLLRHPLVGWSARFMIVMGIVVTVFRICEVGPSADRRGRRRGRLTGSLAVTAPAHSCSTRTCGVIRRATIPQGNGTAARALFGRLMHYGDAIVIQGRGYCTQDEESDSPRA